MPGVLGVGLDPVAGRPLQLRRRRYHAPDVVVGQKPGQPVAGRSGLVHHRDRAGQLPQPARGGAGLAADPAAPGTSRLCWHRYRRPPPTLRARPDRRSYALAAPGPPATVGTTDQVHPRRQPTTTCERGPGPRVRAPPYRLRPPGKAICILRLTDGSGGELTSR